MSKTKQAPDSGPKSTARAKTKGRVAAAAPEGSLPLDLALQGGGSHGAFTWGVLDRLLDDPQIRPVSISGTSAGALNAAVLATGWAAGGRTGAQQALRAFWMDVATEGHCFGDAAAISPAWGAALGWPWSAWAAAPGLSGFNLDNQPWYPWGQQFLRSFSPYQFNPLGDNPLRKVLQRHVQPAALRTCGLALFITATAVRTGQPRVFDAQDLSIDALLASACLPQLFKAVEIDGQSYWDGGYSGNPALWPLIYHPGSLDLLLIKINPSVRPCLPNTPAEIADRVNEITFNAGLVSEMRAIAFVHRLLAEGKVDPRKYRDLRLHMVADEEGLAPLQASSKLNTDRNFLQALHALGHAAAERWLQMHRDDIGQRPTLDLRSTFLSPRQGQAA